MNPPSFSAWKQKLRESLPQPLWELALTVKYARARLPTGKVYEAAVTNRRGIEIGGPSAVFRTILPVYNKVRALDGVNFSSNTIWEGAIHSGPHYKYLGNKTGRQFICEATDLNGIGSGTYEFLLSSHCLEHVANPIKALLEWNRVLAAGSALVLVLPSRKSNFDHRRPFTTFEHILADYHNDVGEHDLTHLEEILALHDLTLDPPAGSLQNFRERSLDNFANRTLHHHVFDAALIRMMLAYTGFGIRDLSETGSDIFSLSFKEGPA
jgi:SAM-dependent methyltransferase